MIHGKRASMEVIQTRKVGCRGRRRMVAACAGAAAVLAARMPVAAATFLWDGASTSGFGLFNEADNWSPNGAPPSDGTADVVFGSTNFFGFTPTISGNLNVSSFTFNSGAVPYLIQAWNNGVLTINSSQGVTDNSPNAESLQLPISLGGSSQTWNLNGGAFTDTGTVSLNAAALTINTSTASTNATFTNAITSSSFGSLIKTGSGTLNLTGGTSYFDTQLTVNAGTLVTTGAVQPGNLSVGTTSGGTLTILNGGSIAGTFDTTISNSGVINVGNPNGTDTGNSVLGGVYLAVNSGTLNVFQGGTVNFLKSIGSGGSGATINLNGGTISAGQAFINTASTFNWTSGTLNLTGLVSAHVSAVIGSLGGSSTADMLGSSLTLSAGKTLSLYDVQQLTTATLVLGTGGTLNLMSGGTLTSGGLSGLGVGGAPGNQFLIGGTFNWVGGTFIAQGYSEIIQSLSQSNLDELSPTLNLGVGKSLVVSPNPGQTNTFGLSIQSGGLLNLSGGSVTAGFFNNSGGFNWTAGTLNITNSSTAIQSGGAFGTSLTLNTGQNLILSGAGQTLSVNSGCLLQVAGGTFTTGFTNAASTSGLYDYGTLNVTNGGAISGLNVIYVTSGASATFSGTGSSVSASIFGCDGTLLIGSGATVSAGFVEFGIASGVSANLTVNGAFNTTSIFALGASGNTTSTVTFSGTSASGQLQQLVDGYSSSTTDALAVLAGAQVTSQLDLYIGTSGAIASANVKGTGSVLKSANGNVIIGSSSATGTVTISTSGQVTSFADTEVGESGTGVVSVSGPGSLLSSSGGGILYIGGNAGASSSIGTVNLSSGGIVSGFSQIQIGINSTGSGTFNANLPSSTNFSTGTLLVASHGTYSQTGGALIANLLSLTGGTFNESSGTVIAGSAIISGGTNTLGTSGLLQVQNGGLQFTGSGSPQLSLTSGTGTNAASLVLAGNVSVNLNSGTATIASIGAGTSPGFITLNGARTFDVESGAAAVQLQVSAQIADGLAQSTLIKTGGGTIVVTNPGNNFTGGITVVGGLLQITSASSFTGGVRLTANGPSFGTVSVDSDAELGASTNTLTVSGGTLLATNSFSTARAITLGDASANGNGTISVNSSDTLTVNSTLGGLAGLIKAGPGTLILNGALSYSGLTAISAGTLKLGTGVSLPSQTVAQVAPGATLDLGTQSLSIPALQNANTGGGAINVESSTLTLGSLGASTVFSGTISGLTSGAIVMAGPTPLSFMGLSGTLSGFSGGVRVSGGTLLLSNSGNSFTGGINVTDGSLQITSDGALGNTSNQLSLSSGGALEVTSAFSTSRTINLSTGGGTIAIAAGNTLTDSGNITGSGPLTISGTTLIPGSAGSGTLTLSTAAAFSGPLTLDGDVLPGGTANVTLSLGANASLHSATSLTLLRRATLALYDSTASGFNKLAASATLNLSGGALTINGPTSSGTATESVGELIVTGGTASTINLIDGTGGPVNITFSSYLRQPGGLLALDLGSSSDRVFFSSLPSGIIPDQTPLPGFTLNENGLTGHAEYDLAQGVIFFGTPEPATTSGGDTNSIPEPATGAVVMGGLLLKLGRRPRRQ